MKMKKPDLSGVKSYLFQKGERVGLVVCAVIAVLLLGIGLMKAGGSNTPWAENFKKMREPLDRQIAATKEISLTDVKPPAITPPWAEHQPGFPWIELSPLPDAPDNQRRNPTILKILDDPKHIQVDSLMGGYFSYELEKGDKVVTFGGGGKNAPAPRQGGAGGQFRFTKITQPGHLVLVTAVFPMHKQLEEYQRQLRYATMSDLLSHPEYLPRALGLTVYRREIKADGKPIEWEPVYKYDGKEGKVDVAERISKLFKEAIIDEDNPKALDKYIYRGMVTPLPELANLAGVQYPSVHYPKLSLQDINVDEEAGIADKMAASGRPRPNKPRPFQMLRGNSRLPNQGDDEATPNWKSVSWKLLNDPDMHDKFMGKIDYFDTSGILEPTEDPQAIVVAAQPGRGRRKPRVQVNVPSPTDPGAKVEPLDALVRFIDIGVAPGKTYQYSFRVHMANPNFGKPELVAYQGLAAEKELVSPFSYSPQFSIPTEFQYYAVDQGIDQQIQDGSDKQAARAEPPLAYGKWTTPVQVQRWVGNLPESKLTVADWAIAERLLVRRGDTVGRYGVVVQIPVWDKVHETFEIGWQLQNAKKSNQARNHTGVPIDFIVDTPPPLLVDFEGGWKTQVKVGTTTISKDQSATDILVLTPEGKLVVRNSRADTDTDNPAAAERNRRWDEWRKGIKRLRDGDNAGGGAGPGGVPVPPR